MRKGPWLRRTALALLVLAASSAVISRSLQAGRVRRYLNGRLEAAFGRPVEVGEFSFSLLAGLRLEADSITVAEDPGFGHEYFLRAERLAAGLRWSSLARGRFEFGTLSFTRPSLNLVRAPDGHWNVESWLPPPVSLTSAGPAPAGAIVSARLHRIEVDTGRINFKLGADKHPFALVEVTGVLEQESPGRWRIDLEARPMRAAVSLQEAGTLRVRGRIAGTSARLQPAELAVTWQGASLADALRLVRGQDYGVRGQLQVELTARSGAPGASASAAANHSTPLHDTSGDGGSAPWSFSGTARLRGVHRWDLPQRPGDPALNLRAEAQWLPAEARLEFTKGLVEAPRSSVEVTGRVEWKAGIDPQFRVRSSWIHFADLLAWHRAFRPGVAENLNLDGNAEMDFIVRGWPPRLEQGELSSSGARLRAAGLPAPVRVGGILARVRRGRLELAPTTLSFATAAQGGTAAPVEPSQPSHIRPRPGVSGAVPHNALRVQGTAGPGEARSTAGPQAWQFTLELSGQTDRAQDWLAAAQGLCYTVHRGWSAEGPAEVRLTWRGSFRPFATTASGTIDLRGLAVRTSYLNQPVVFTNAGIELRGSERRVTLAVAAAFGGRWEGTLRRSDPAAVWEFDLTADHLDVAELDRWLGPRARPSLLERVVPFATAGRNTAELDAVLGGLRGRGRLRVEELVVSPLSLGKLHGQAEIDGRSIAVRDAQGEFYGGSIKGSFNARLGAGPAYDFDVQFERVDLKSLSGATASLQERFAGAASGTLTLAAHGVGRQGLLRSLEGYGMLSARGARMRGLDVRAVFLGGGARAGVSQFAAADARFSLAAGKITIEKLQLSDREDAYEAEGSVDFSRALDLRIRPAASGMENRPGGSASRTFRIVGPLDAPQVSWLEPGAVKRGAKK